MNMTAPTDGATMVTNELLGSSLSLQQLAGPEISAKCLNVK